MDSNKIQIKNLKLKSVIQQKEKMMINKKMKEKGLRKRKKRKLRKLL